MSAYRYWKYSAVKEGVEQGSEIDLENKQITIEETMEVKIHSSILPSSTKFGNF